MSITTVRDLMDRLNQYRHEYYNLNSPSASDAVYDRLFDELLALERKTGIIMANSPTYTVGYQAVSVLEKVRHSIPLLSLDKTKSIDDLMQFGKGLKLLLMPKLDGLTVQLTYESGWLVQAATRGDGEEGEIITHNAKTFMDVPVSIPYAGLLVVPGEAFIHKSDFDVLKTSLTDGKGKPYRNARNLAAGSARLLYGGSCKARKIAFLPFNVLIGLDVEGKNSKSRKLALLASMGFASCSSYLTQPDYTKDSIEATINLLKENAEKADIPIDGIVATYDDIAYSKTCGRTGHHYKDGMAFKFNDDLYETVLRSIEWTPSRTGEISPVALYDTVEIDGCEVSRASLHNLSFIKGLELMPGCRILVSKRNMIIPQVEDNLDRGVFSAEALFPQYCPCCGQPTRIRISDEDKASESLFCDNSLCETRRLRQFVHFVSKKAMNIEGLSEATLEKLINRGWLKSFMDIYYLNEHSDEIMSLDGFGEKSWNRLWDAIQSSRNTTFERYLIAMDISMIWLKSILPLSPSDMVQRLTSLVSELTSSFM